MQMGVSQAIPLAQGSTLKLRIFGATLPMQCDGEAWLQHPGILQISHHNQALMLVKNMDTEEEPPSTFF